MKHTGKLPPEQEFIRSQCFHPTGRFVELTTEEVEQSIPSRFEKMVRLYPDQVAVKSRNPILTYEELNVTANRVAHSLLRECGDQPEPIALLADHDGGTVAAMLAILKAGKIRMPVDPSLRCAKLSFTLRDSQARTLLVSSKGCSASSPMPYCKSLFLDEKGEQALHPSRHATWQGEKHD